MVSLYTDGLDILFIHIYILWFLQIQIIFLQIVIDDSN